VPIWNIPFAHNPFFTGRDDLLEQLHIRLCTTQTVAVSQPQAICGLGGIGKTQFAIEYAYRYKQEYQTILWARAETPEALHASYTEIASMLHLPQRNAPEQEVIVQAVKDWLKTHQDWLLLLDNADELNMVQPFLPSRFTGHILLTTRAQIIGKLARRLEIETLDARVGALFLLRRASVIEAEAILAAASASDQSMALTLTEELGGLPLALDQAGAYIEETKCGLAGYQQRYRTQRAELLARRGMLVDDHPQPVSTTWLISFQKVKESSMAAELLQICAFLAPDAIPEELLVEALRTPLPVLGTAETAGDRGVAHCSPITTGQLDEAIATLRAYSLVQRSSQDHLLSVHRLVQAVIRESMGKQEQVSWMIRVVCAVAALFPDGTFGTWQQCERFLPHALACETWVAQRDLVVLAGARLLNQAGFYLAQHAQYQRAEALYQTCLKILKKSQHPDSLLLAAIVFISLGNIYSETGEYDKAKQYYYDEGLEIFNQNKELDRREFALYLNNIAILSKVGGWPEKSEELYIRSLTIQLENCVPSRESSGKPDPQDIATLCDVLGTSQEEIHRSLCSLLSEKTAPCTFAQVLNNLAVLFVEQFQRYETAERLFHLSLWPQKQYQEHDPANEQYDSDYDALSRSNLANLYTIWGSNPAVQEETRRTFYEKAKELYQESMDLLKERYQRAEHPHIAYPLLGQGILWYLEQDYTEAEKRYQECLAIWKKWQPNHPQIGYAYYNLANLSLRYQDVEGAEQYHQECLKIWGKYLGPHHLHTGKCKEILTLLRDNPKGEIDVLKAQVFVLPAYRSFRLYFLQKRS
jgi:tetratricopeptide (TPR) repeat protein